MSNVQAQGAAERSAPLILVTNDDGIGSPGLHALVAAVADLGELLVAAPHVQHTGAGRSISDAIVRGQPSPQFIEGRAFTFYAVEGTPAQAVRWGIMAQAPRQPSLVLSGINYGENLATDLTTSGTVGAAMEGAVFDIPSLAISLEVTSRNHYSARYDQTVDFSVAAHFARRFARVVLESGLPVALDLLAINVPHDATVSTPCRVTFASRRRYSRSVTRHLGRDGPVLQGYTWDLSLARSEPPDSDLYAVLVDRVVAVTPLTIDLSARANRQEVAGMLGIIDAEN